MRHIHVVFLCIYSFFYYPGAVHGETLWDYLAQHQANVELMDIAPSNDHFFLVGVKRVIIPWNTGSTPEVDSIVPPQRRRLLLVQKVDNREQDLVWHKEYANLPDVNEVYSIAATADNQLCVVYGGEPLLETAINPLMLRLNANGDSLWYKPVFPPADSADLDFLPTEQIANLDAINVAATSNKACLLALITRSVQSQSETFRLHLIRYDSQGNINWHKVLPTGLYGTTYLLTNSAASRHFVVTTNLSRDAALEAMILGQPFVPQINIATIDSEGTWLHNIYRATPLSDTWLNGAIVSAPDSLILVGKKHGSWIAHIQSDGHVINEYIDNGNDRIGDGFQAIANRDKSGFIITHNGFISIFDLQLRLQTTLNIADFTTQSYANPNLSSQLPRDLPVEKLLPLNTNDYLLFYKYGSRLEKINIKLLRKD